MGRKEGEWEKNRLVFSLWSFVFGKKTMKPARSESERFRQQRNNIIT
jgi:hypothetical protein